jgi:predicted metalloprotease
MDRGGRPWWGGAVRPILLVLLLASVLTGCAIEVVPGSASNPPTGRSAPGGSSDIPVDSTVGAAPGPVDSDTRADDEQVAVRITDEFWNGWFADQGLRYIPPTVEGGYVGTNGPSCGGEPSVPGNAYYCPDGNFLAWDEDLMQAGYTEIGDAWVYLVIAHEWGHAIQAQLPDRFVSQRIELQADCLAGAALQGAADQGLVRIEPGDDEEIAQTLEAVADDYRWTDESSHGNARQRTAAFQGGVRDGVEGCLRM